MWYFNTRGQKRTAILTVTSEAVKVWIQHSCLQKCPDLEADSLWESFFFFAVLEKTCFVHNF